MQLDKESIGLIQNQTLIVKFGIKPKLEQIRDLFVNDDFVQFIATTDGDFDLLMVRKVPAVMAGGRGDKYVHWGIQTATKLLEYRPQLNSLVPVLTHIGFTPILNSTIEKLDLTSFGIDELDKKILMMLNDNSRLSYKAISNKLDADVGTIRYRIRMLSSRNVIRKFTIALTNPPTAYNMAFMINYQLTPGIMNRYKNAFEYYNSIDGTLPVINKFQYLALTMGSNLLFGIGCFDDKAAALKEVVAAHKELYKEDKISIKHARITNIIKGYLPIRNLDVATEFRQIKWDVA